MRLKRLFGLAAASVAGLSVAGCISFGTDPPDTLLSLTSEAAVPAGQTQTSASSSTITIAVPAVPQSLSTLRVPVQSSETAIAYVKDAQWVEPPARQFARLLSDTITARSGRIVLSQQQSFADPGARLAGELRSFGLDATSTSAVVVYDASLIRNEGKAVEKRRFEARVPVSAIEAAAIGPSLNQAANQVAGQVADWVGR